MSANGAGGRRAPLVVGVGAPLRGDDAVGWAVVERLRRSPQGALLDLREEQQLAPELAADLAEVPAAAIVDASVDLAPGVVRVARVASSPERPGALSHSLDAGALVALAGSLYGRAAETWLVEVGAASFDLGAPLSSVVEGAVDEAAAAVIARLLR
ncbi:MAG: hydrogenase maturation protease [Candidatus Polarisedimenticolia bacterium]